jgi:WD40 repeat protein/lipoprotein NlpI
MVGEPDSWVGTVSDTSSDGNLVVITPSIEGLQQDSEGHFGAPYRELGYASRVHDTRTGAEVSLEGELGGGLFSPSGKWIIGGEGPNESVVLWDSATGKQLRVFGSHPEVPYKFERPNPTTTTEEGAISAISPDERLLAASWGKQVRIFDLEDGQDIAKFALPHGDSVSTLTFSPSGKFLLGTVVNHEPAPGKGIARIWNTSKWDEVVTFDVPLDFPSSSEIHLLPVFSPDETLVAFTKDEGTAVDLFDTKTGLKVRSFPHRMFGAAFDSSRKLQAAGRGLMELWDVSADNVLARFGLLQGGTDWVVLTPDGLFDGTTNGFASILWRFGNDTFNSASPEAFFNEYFRPGLLSEIYSGARPRARTDISQVDRRQPEIALTLGTTAPATNVSSRKVRVVVQVSEVSADGTHEKGSGAKDVRLFRNGALVHIWRGDVLNGHSTVRLDTDVTVTAGDNRLTAYCFNGNNIKSKDADIKIKGAESLRRKGNAYLIVIGIDHYSNSSYDLKFATADAKTFGDEIKSALDHLGTFQHVEVIPLLDAAATKENILRVFGQLSSTRADSGSPHTGKAATAEPEDAVFIYFAGHGTAQQSRFYLIPFDLGYKGDREKLNETDLNMILNHSISDLDLEAAFEKIDAGKLLLIIDACNSGQALDAAEKRRGPMNSAGLAQLAYEKGMYILTAAQSYQQASEVSKLKHGLLTYALVNEGLQSAAAAGEDGQIDLRSWLDYAVKRVPELQENGPNEKRNVVYVGADNPLLQQPRVFYRRETEEQPFVVAKIPNGDSSKNRSDGRPSAEKSRSSSLKAGSEESRPYNADQYAARASLAFRWADYEEGVSALDKALRERPNEATWYISRCEGKSQFDDFQGALRDCDRALAFNNLSRAWRAVALYDKGVAERGLSEYKNAQLDYDFAIKAYPELGDAYPIYGERGRLRFATADTNGALRELDEAIRRQPREPLFHLYRGIIRAAMADKAGAFADFQEANRLNPAEPYYAFWLVAFGGAKDSLTLKYCSENKDWASNICRFYLGRISEENLLEQARNATRDASRKLCEALTYVGLLAENDHKLTKQARSRYVEAIQTGKANLVEFEWAQARIRDKTY